MRKGLLFVTPVAALVVSLFACSTAERRSGFNSESSNTEPEEQRRFTEGDGTKHSEDGGCSSSQTEISRIPVVIEFVVDESGSMSGEKWTAQRDALHAAFEDMKNTADPATFVGVQLFASSPTKSVKPGSLLDSNHYDKLVAAITPTQGDGSTATEEALEAGYSTLENFSPPKDSGFDPGQMTRALVLMSDGEPNGGAGEKQRCQNLAGEKFALTPPSGPILTFAIGVGDFPKGSGYDPAFMGRIAIAGGTADPNQCNPESTDESLVCHYQITPKGDISATKQKFIDAINAIRALTTSCEFTFTKTPDADLAKTEVFMTDKDGKKTKVPNDPENGWTFDDPENPTKVVLNGDACGASSGTVAGRVDVVLGCKGAN